MKSLWRWRMVGVALFCGSSLVGCASPAPNVRYPPRHLQESKLTIESARAIVAAGGSHIINLHTDGKFLHEATVVLTVRHATVEFRGTFSHSTYYRHSAHADGPGGGGTITGSIPLTDQLISIIKTESMTLVNFGGQPLMMDFDHLDNAKPFADALQALLDYGAKGQFIGQNEMDGFAQVVARYQSASPKPTLSEEARKLKVQAEFALEKKQYAQAIERYEEALNIAPWWADGHFNRALLLGEAEDYAEAVSEMKKYLVLEPNAKDARAAQDKLYQWEGEAKKIQIRIKDYAPR